MNYKKIEAKVRRGTFEAAGKTALLGSLLALALALPAAAADPQGFIYGEVKMRDGKVYEGQLRWEDEEASWGDFFNGNKEERPYIDEVPRRDRRRSKPITIFGIPIGLSWHEDWDDDRSLKVRFGDLKRIEVRGGDRAILAMKNGSEIEIDGGSNDVEGEVWVWDQELGKLELDWRRIERVTFLPTPASLKVDAERIYGRVKTRDGDFKGFIQWDQDESLSTDKLDGSSDDGKVSIEFGQIKSIERSSRNASRVSLKSGRELLMDDSNDVDNDNRGIFVEDVRFGRVLVSWDAFDRLDLEPPPGSGPKYGDFAPTKKLEGRVVTRDGQTHAGRIVVDIDEEDGWETLDGDWREISYSIPFAMVGVIEPLDGRSSRVTLHNGEKLELEDTADVDDNSSGVLVLPAEGRFTYVPWDDVKRIELNRP
jgi:hypothetical protein